MSAAARNPWALAEPAVRVSAPPALPEKAARCPRGPYAPSAGKLARFWIAGPLTLILFTPILLAGVFGAPTMLIGMVLAYMALRTGRDAYSDFAALGFHAGLATMIVVAFINVQVIGIFVLGLLFGPLMAMTFRLVAGRWRPDDERNKPPKYPAASS